MTAIRDRSAAAKKGWDKRGRGRTATERHAAAKARHDAAVAKATKAIDVASKATSELKTHRTVANQRKSVAAIERANRATAAMQKAKSSLDRAEAHVAKKEAKAKAKADKVEARAKAKAEKSAAKAKVKQEKQIAREKAKAAKAAEKAKVKAEKVAAKAAAKAEKVAAKEKAKADRSKAKSQKQAGKNHDVMPSGLTPKEQAEATAVHKVFGQYHTLQGLKDKLLSNFTHKQSGITADGHISVNDDRVGIHGNIVKDGKPVGQFWRTFSRSPSGKLKVKHVNFTMDEGVSGKGVGRSMVEQSIKTYKDLGVKEISLEPHWIGR